MNSQNLELTQKIGIRLSQQQLRFVRMLELNAPELDEAVERELEDNPALGVKSDDAEEEPARYLPLPVRQAPADDVQFTPPDNTETLYDHLLAQLSERELSTTVDEAARFIAGSLDSNGYLTVPLEQLVDDMAFGPGLDVTAEEADRAFAEVRSLDPPGIGALNLKDCLELQLAAMPKSRERDDAMRVVGETYEAFIRKHRHRIVSQLHLDDERVDKALDLIVTLNPKPGASYGHNPSDRANVIVPDFTVTNEDGELRIALNNRIPELRIDESFETAMATLQRSAKGRARKGSEFVVSRYNDARDFIRILAQRQNTMMQVMTAIVSIQKEYFLTEDVYKLKPMMIKNVSDLTGLDMSVISRATNNKYVSTPWGIFPLRFFFSDSVGEEKEGEEATTNRKIEAQISSLIAAEDKHHPLSDRIITEEMGKRGFDLSRRTVAKYRDRLGIPVARLRKGL